MVETPSLPQLKGFGNDMLSSKEKTIGAIVTILLIGAALLGLNALLPGINHFLSGLLAAVGKLVMLAISLAGLALFLAVAMNKRTHTLLKLGFYWLARKTTMAFVRYGPTTIIEIYNDHLTAKAQKFGEKKMVVDSKREVVARTIEENQASINESQANAKTLKSRHFDDKQRRWDSIEHKNLFMEYSSNISFREASNVNLRKQLIRLEYYLQILEKFQQAFNHRRNVIKNFCKILNTEYEAMKAAAEGTHELSALFGTDDLKQVFDMTIDFMRERIAFFTSEVDTFMSENLPVVTELDLQNEVAEDQLLARLTDMDKKADHLIDQAAQDEVALTDIRGLATLVKSNQATAATQTTPSSTRRHRYLGGN
ncbi:MAG: hypothetical protein WC528_05125 [Patescibacteria group bacterium]